MNRLGSMPDEATLATLAYCQGAAAMPAPEQALLVFSHVPASWSEVPVDRLKVAIMQMTDIAQSHADFEAYHQWYVAHGDTPQYTSKNRWPCIASEDFWRLSISNPSSREAKEDFEALDDGWHRFHAYVRAGHETIPVLRCDMSAWWVAHKRWEKADQARLFSNAAPTTGFDAKPDAMH